MIVADIKYSQIDLHYFFKKETLLLSSYKHKFIPGQHGHELRTISLLSLPLTFCNLSYSYVGFAGLPRGFTEDLLCALDPSKYTLKQA